MNGLMKYRILALALAGMFGVFNIGIPIIVASCPMAGMMQGGRCGTCDDQDDPATSKLTPERNTSCCVTTIVAERNTNEFVQEQANVHSPALQTVLTVFPYTVTRNPSPVSGFILVSASPPTVTDIPIFTSSLLI